MNPPTICYLVTEDWYFWSHRIDLARAAMRAGYSVTLVARFTEHRARIEAEGIRCIPVAFVRSMGNPFAELRLLFRLAQIIKRESPAIVHAVAWKPMLLSAAAIVRCPNIQFCHAVTGLGYLFIAPRPALRLLRALVSPVLRWLLGRSNCQVIVQNDDDLATLRAHRIVSPHNTVTIRGAGVDLTQFTAQPLPAPGSHWPTAAAVAADTMTADTGAADRPAADNGNPAHSAQTDAPVVLLPARMLRDKGVYEFATAAGLLHARGIAAVFALVGGLDASNAAALTHADMDALLNAGHVQWWGHRTNMPAVYARATVVCLPSYREGFPKALLEAAACGRPLVATDVPGCRDICRNGETGSLVPARNAQALADAIAALLQQPARCALYGAAARALVEREFSSTIINAQTLALYRRLGGTSTTAHAGQVCPDAGACDRR